MSNWMEEWMKGLMYKWLEVWCKTKTELGHLTSQTDQQRQMVSTDGGTDKQTTKTKLKASLLYPLTTSMTARMRGQKNEGKNNQ